MSVQVKALKNGPFEVSGDLSGLSITDRDGKDYDLSGRPKVYLCRCGHSSMKPFCDGQHQKNDFQAEETAG